jgi:hypothetical protein
VTERVGPRLLAALVVSVLLLGAFWIVIYRMPIAGAAVGLVVVVATLGLLLWPSPGGRGGS